MKKALVSFALIVGVLAAGVPAQAQEAVAADNKLALLFGFGGFGMNTAGYETGPTGGNSFLTALVGGAAGGGLGVKYMVIPNLGVRGMLSVATASSKTPANPDTGEIGADGTASATSWGLGVGVEYHLTTGKLRPYVGGTLRYGSASTESKDPEVVPSGDPLDQVKIQNNEDCESFGGREFCAGSTLGGGALFGVEYFPWDNVSLAAEYQVGYAAVSRADQKMTLGNTSVTTKVGSESGFGVTTLGLLTLSFYFL